MNIWFESILNGIKIYGYLAPAFIAFALLFRNEKKELNPIMFIINQMTLMYLICLISVTLFPLPTVEQASKLSTYDAQLIPFRFVGDVIRERSLRSVAQVVFNVILTAPLGLFLYINKNMTILKAAIITFGISLLIELAQFTGLFFIYNGSYRLFDVDDLFLNTIGGIMGYKAAAVLVTKKIRVAVFHAASEF